MLKKLSRNFNTSNFKNAWERELRDTFPMMIICITILILNTLAYSWENSGEFPVISEIRQDVKKPHCCSIKLGNQLEEEWEDTKLNVLYVEKI